MTEEQFELDDRFPTGEWTGFYIEPHSRQRFVMDLYLRFADTRVSGRGDDVIGEFTINGDYETKTARCTWIKQYVGQHCVEYCGAARERGIIGQWTLDGEDGVSTGAFFIWPRALGNLESLFERLFVEYDLELVLDVPELSEEFSERA